MVIKTKSGSESSILSVGVYRPSRLVPNSEIVDAIDSSDEWIVQRTGIESRRFAGPDESVAFLLIEKFARKLQNKTLQYGHTRFC